MCTSGYNNSQRQKTPAPALNFIHRFAKVIHKFIHRLSTGLSTGDLSTGYPQAVHKLCISYPQDIHRRSYPQDIHSCASSYPQVYPHGPKRPSKAAHGVLRLGYARASTKVYSSFYTLGVDKCVNLCWSLRAFYNVCTCE